MSHSQTQQPIAFHLSINVSDIPRSVEFFSKVFGTPPAKRRDDYAKFELTNPPITFSLEPGSPAEQGVLNHVGFKFDSAEELVAFQRRLEMAGIRSQREEGVECCYARQTKFWLHDPDSTLWEMYILEGDLEHRGGGQDLHAITDSDNGNGYRRIDAGAPAPIQCARSSAPELGTIAFWSHRLGSPLEIPAGISAGSHDEVALQGTFNGGGTLEFIEPFLQQVAERLKPGGRVAIHCLTSDRPLEQVPQLAGPASVVKSVPQLERLIDALEAAGFEAIRLNKYGSRACFTAGEAELRETMIDARKPETASEDDLVRVVYTGPLRELVLEDGTSLRRAREATVPRRCLPSLQSIPQGDAIVVLETATKPLACTS